MKKPTERYVVCVKTGDAGDLEIRKLYQVLPDDSAADDKFIRVIDESGEDYLYPASYFVVVDVPEESARALQIRPRSRSDVAR